MERKNNLIVGLLATAITYSSLMFFIGPRHYSRSGFYHNHRQYGWHKHHECRKEGNAIWDKHRRESQDKTEIDSPKTN
ncbi:MAG: hypothetical protein ABI761_11790 [Saprospiraceae bacterium]